MTRENPSFSVDLAMSALRGLRPREDGSIISHSGFEGVEYIPEIEKSLEALRLSGIVETGDLDQKGEQVLLYLENPALITQASLKSIRNFLGHLYRQERFSAGLIGKAIQQGVFIGIRLRLLELIGPQ